MTGALERDGDAETPIQASAYRYCDALDLNSLTLEEARRGDVVGAFVEQRDPRHFIRRGPRFVDNPFNAAGFDGLDDLQIGYPPAFLVSAPRARLLGYRSVVTENSFVLSDDSVMFSSPEVYVSYLSQTGDSFLNEDTGFGPGTTSTTLLHDRLNQPDVELKGRYVSLCSHEPGNYGSFLFRVLPKLASVRKWGLEDFPVIAFVIHDTALEWLGMAGVNLDTLVRYNTKLIYRADHVLVPSMRNNQAFLDPETRLLLKDMREKFGSPPRPEQRLYVSRRRFGAERGLGRRLVNELELESALASLGFKIVSPERLSAREQIKLFSSASMVVGPAGSGMFNAMFCWPGTQLIDIESEPWWLHAHTCLFGSCELDYGLNVGAAISADVSPHQPWKVDVASVCERVAMFRSRVI